jgi:hypothetical protein
MSNLPAFFAGPITQEYAELSLTGADSESNPTETCGSDCSGGECEGEQTCPASRKEEEEQETSRKKKHSFLAVVEGWNEPPATWL